MPLPLREIDHRTVLVVVEGKLRGSRARALGEALGGAVATGYDRAIVDIRPCGSVDSLGAQAIEDALALGLDLVLVVAHGFDAAEQFATGAVARGEVPRFHSLEDAVRFMHKGEDSSVAVA